MGPSTFDKTTTPGPIRMETITTPSDGNRTFLISLADFLRFKVVDGASIKHVSVGN